MLSPNLLGVLVEAGAIEVLLPGEQLVVHLPELPLGARRLGRQSRRHGVLVEGERVVAVGDLDVLAVVLDQRAHRASGAAAVRALEVGELDDGDLRLASAAGRCIADGDLVDLGAGARTLARRGSDRRRLGPLHERRVDHGRRRPLVRQLFGARDLVVDDLLELIVRLGPLHVAPVDVEIRRPLHANLLAGRQVGVDARLARMRVERGLELVHVEPNLLGVLLEACPVQRLLVGEHLVVHLPELPLRLGGDGGLGGQRRVVVERQRVVTEEEPDLLGVVLHDLVDRRDHAAAKRALEVRELDDGHRGVGGTAHRTLQRHPDAVDAVARPLGGRHRRRRGRIRVVFITRCQAPEAVSAPQHHQQQCQYGSFVHDQLHLREDENAARQIKQAPAGAQPTPHARQTRDLETSNPWSGARRSIRRRQRPGRDRSVRDV